MLRMSLAARRHAAHGSPPLRRQLNVRRVLDNHGEHFMAKILSLGGCGFIGSYLTRKLLDEGPRGDLRRRFLEVRLHRARFLQAQELPAHPARHSQLVSARLRGLRRGRVPGGADRRHPVFPQHSLPDRARQHARFSRTPSTARWPPRRRRRSTTSRRRWSTSGCSGR